MKLRVKSNKIRIILYTQLTQNTIEFNIHRHIKGVERICMDELKDLCADLLRYSVM